MATPSVLFHHAERFTEWFPDFLRKELAPYPGRGAVVARMVIAATLSAVLIVTFRIPGGAVGALCAFILSRESLLSTAKSAAYLVLAFLIGGLFIPIGARFFASIPITHFLWEAASLFMVFFLLRTLTNYAVAVGLSLVATNILSIWYLPGPAERNVELTLWQVAAALIGALVTLAVEVVFHAIYGRDEVTSGIDLRLLQIENLMTGFAAGRPASSETAHMLAQYAVVGMGAQRRRIALAGDEPLHRARMSTLVALTGRSIDFAAALSSISIDFTPSLQQRAARLAEHIAEVRHCLLKSEVPHPQEPIMEMDAATPLLSEVETMISLMPSIFISQNAMDPRFAIPEGPSSSSRIFVEDAFTNPEHLRFVLSGTLAAMICYVLYVSLAWPGISTSVTTCVLTSLSNVGASRQKQVLRVAGAALGGFVFGLGSQMFVLPNIDSITGFTVLFAAVTAFAAWIASSSSRLSYAGLQIALAFYLINLSEFSIQTSLTVARDRAIGVLLGVSMMWLVFERFYPRPAADEMVRVFVRNLRLMADLIVSSPWGADSATIVRIRRMRDQIYNNFGEVNAQADAVPFETGPGRAGHMAARDRIRRWQAALRTFYLLEAPLIQFRVYGTPDQQAGAYAQIEDAFRDQCAQSFRKIADRIEHQLNQRPPEAIAFPSLLSAFDAPHTGTQALLTEREQALLRMSRTIASLADRLQREAVSEPLYATE
ncbi:FUSC family protein [Paracidobacterium acidisoli]|uniref:FUSC family protein n=1 Tax=Paracidobacterium acidisoli TaxID=2303751 RepID=A0A372ILV3_9BACT|nr:FUSC family protein [Paracidobacterium acidisoli]MBT9332471.1 FUSC family protein [Paracidobacterium acidisoli]